MVVLAASGCSLGAKGPDPERPRDEVPECDTGKGSVVLDGLMTTLLGLGALAAFGDDEGKIGGTLLATSAIFAASGYRGNRVANECKAAFDEFAQRSRPEPQMAKRPAAVRKRPSTAAKSPQQIDLRVPEPETQPVTDDQLAETPAPAPPPPPYQAPRPKPEPKPTKPADENDWSSFWKERP